MNAQMQTRRNRMKLFSIILTICKYWILVVWLCFIMMTIYAALQPVTDYQMDTTSSGWEVSMNLSDDFDMASNTLAIRHNISSKIMPFISIDEINPKNAYLLYSIVYGNARICFVFIIALFLAKMAKDTLADTSPFSVMNSRRFRCIGLFLTIYLGFGNFILNLLFEALITHNKQLDYGNIRVYALILGVVMFFIAEVFDYGRMLQDDSDSII